METVTAKIEVNGHIETAVEYLSYSTAHELMFSLFCLIGICADLIIIHILFRFRRMRTIPNTFLSNWIIADACYLLLMATFYIIILVMKLTGITGLSIYYSCVHVQMGVAVYFAIVYFVLLLLVDWVIAAYFQRYTEIFRNYYKFFIAFIWILSLLFWGVSTGLCFKSESFSLSLGYDIFLISIVSLFIIAIQTYTFVQKFKGIPMDYPTLMLTLASIFILSRVPETLLYMFNGGVLIEVIFMYVTPLHSILNLFLLYLLSKDFQGCLLQLWKRSDRGYMEAANAFENPDKREDEFPVRISINNSNEELAPNGL